MGKNTLMTKILAYSFLTLIQIIIICDPFKLL